MVRFVSIESIFTICPSHVARTLKLTKYDRDPIYARVRALLFEAYYNRAHVTSALLKQRTISYRHWSEVDRRPYHFGWVKTHERLLKMQSHKVVRFWKSNILKNLPISFFLQQKQHLPWDVNGALSPCSPRANRTLICAVSSSTSMNCTDLDAPDHSEYACLNACLVVEEIFRRATGDMLSSFLPFPPRTAHWRQDNYLLYFSSLDVEY